MAETVAVGKISLRETSRGDVSLCLMILDFFGFNEPKVASQQLFRVSKAWLCFQGFCIESLLLQHIPRLTG